MLLWIEKKMPRDMQLVRIFAFFISFLILWTMCFLSIILIWQYNTKTKIKQKRSEQISQTSTQEKKKLNNAHCIGLCGNYSFFILLSIFSLINLVSSSIFSFCFRKNFILSSRSKVALWLYSDKAVKELKIQLLTGFHLKKLWILMKNYSDFIQKVKFRSLFLPKTCYNFISNRTININYSNFKCSAEKFSIMQ